MKKQLVTCLGLALLAVVGPVSAQRGGIGGMFRGSTDDPAIRYSSAPLDNVVTRLTQKLQDGRARLTFEGRSGYLRSVLAAL